MNEGVKILLERMKTNPEEFLVDGLAISSKWGRLISEYLDHLDDEDATVLKTELNKLKQQAFTEKVMKELLAPEEDNSLGKPWYSKQSAMPLGGATPARTSGLTLQSDGNGGVLWANSLVKDPTLEAHMEAHLQSLRDKLEVEEKKPHKTLFGKLFNYL